MVKVCPQRKYAAQKLQILTPKEKFLTHNSRIGNFFTEKIKKSNQEISSGHPNLRIAQFRLKSIFLRYSNTLGKSTSPSGIGTSFPNF